MAPQPDDTEGGLRVVLSPVQLAAVLQDGSLSAPETATGRLMNRVFGGLQMIAGAAELVGSAALFLAPEPTMATKVGGAVLGANGLDNTGTGAVQLWTGEQQTTLTAQAAAAAARSLGCEPDTADTVGVVVDIAVPLVVAAGLGAARALSIRAGMIELQESEAAGGHTIARHVAKDEAFLRNRLATEPRISGAGTFGSLRQAGRFVSKALRANTGRIRAWAAVPSSTNGANLVLIFDAQETVGKVIPRATGMLQNATKLRVVLKKASIGKKVYFILTAFPIP